jgi:pimeloyl-ACP methyl ester carboxylesterase
LHILFEPTTASSDLAIDIVAVHGLGGDGYSTWTDEKSGKLWLRDFLPGSQGFGNARVMTFSYGRSEWPGRRTFGDLWFRDLAKSLLEHVKLTRMTTNTPTKKPIMFIGHSLGGIIIKTAFLIARSSVNSDIFKSTKSVIFFGTPCSEREQEAECRLILQNIFEAAGIKPNEAFRSSRHSVEPIANVSRDFRRASRELLITSFYEREKYNGVLVVSGNQARGDFANETTIGLDANHHTISKLASKEEGFTVVHQAMHMNLIGISKALDAKENPYTEDQRTTWYDDVTTTEPFKTGRSIVNSSH